MKDSLLEVVGAYFTALDNTITITDADGASKTLRFYDVVPSSVGEPYIYFVDYITNEIGTKDGYLTEVRVTLQVVTSYIGSYGGAKDSANITDEILTAIIDGARFDTTNFKTVTASLENSSLVKQQTDEQTRIIRQLTIKHIVEQK